MMDFNNEVKADDPVLKLLSIICGGSSILAILVTEMLLYFGRDKDDDEVNMKRSAERNLNLCMSFAQLGFLIFVGRTDILPCAVCESFGAATHFGFVACYAWIVIDSSQVYYRYNSDAPQTNLKFLSIAAYGVAFAIAGGVLITSLQNDHHLYLRRSVGGHVDSCWLNDWAEYAIIIPIGVAVLLCLVRMVLTYVWVKKNKSDTTCEIILDLLVSFRSTLVLTFVMTLNIVFAFVADSHVFGYIIVVLNVFPGFFILLNSTVFNSEVDIYGNLKKNFRRKNV